MGDRKSSSCFLILYFIRDTDHIFKAFFAMLIFSDKLKDRLSVPEKEYKQDQSVLPLLRLFQEMATCVSSLRWACDHLQAIRHIA